MRRVGGNDHTPCFGIMEYAGHGALHVRLKRCCGAQIPRAERAKPNGGGVSRFEARRWRMGVVSRILGAMPYNTVDVVGVVVLLGGRGKEEMDCISHK